MGACSRGRLFGIPVSKVGAHVMGALFEGALNRGITVCIILEKLNSNEI